MRARDKKDWGQAPRRFSINFGKWRGSCEPRVTKSHVTNKMKPLQWNHPRFLIPSWTKTFWSSDWSMKEESGGGGGDHRHEQETLIWNSIRNSQAGQTDGIKELIRFPRIYYLIRRRDEKRISHYE